MLSCEEDAKDYSKLVELGCTVHSNEAVLTGALRQELDRSQHILASPPDADGSPEATTQRRAKRRKR